MIPQIAHHPRHLSQQFGDPGFIAPPFDPQRIPDRLEHLPFRSPRNLPSSSQRLYSVESHGSQRVGLAASSPTQPFGRRYHDPSEHMLRRKTPNGTLAAGYDGTPVQWSSKAPALKHVLLPMSAGASQTGAIPLPDDHIQRQRSNSLGWGYQPVTQFRGDGGLRMNSDPGNWTYPFSNSPNVLDNLSMQQATTTFFPNNGMQIPTVLQPPYQPSPGPTASNDDGLYGPYWPDGKFVPYRPAAFREAGHRRGNHDIDISYRFQQPTTSPVEFMPPFRQSSFNPDSSRNLGHHSFPSSDTSSCLHENGYRIPQQARHVHDTSPIYSPLQDGSRTPTAHSFNRASNAHFKEKTLSWAHSIYVDLLAYLHQTKKENRQARQAHGFKPYSKTNIYPKPPRQPTSSLGNSDWSSLYNSAPENDATTRKHAGNQISNSHRSPSSSSFGSWQPNGESGGEARYARFSNQEVVPHYVSPFQAAQPSTSPLGKAKEALEMLTTLCEQSGWAWIDGMLLGGCLAYGLEEYHKALEWYSKINAIDPK